MVFDKMDSLEAYRRSLGFLHEKVDKCRTVKQDEMMDPR